ncbi:uncharacterized protein LOC113231976 [Hyposmocoma kahamanoa]|uniref:uncharacterized protein LOC113231976 n=1 Tax=Hyposmocoma kahamanoa TaxID=1477025 RepID=UPI000E6D6A64|nr:uncharacterized protein LOC113231976 [Hyposmocoma kahamanoa]
MGLQHIFLIQLIYTACIVTYIRTKSCDQREFVGIEDGRVLQAARSVLDRFKQRHSAGHLGPNVQNLVISSLIKGRPKATSFPKSVNYRLIFCAVPVLACQQRPTPRCPLTHVCSAFIDESRGLRILEDDCYPDVEDRHSNDMRMG